MNTTKLTNRQLFFILFMIRTTIIVAVLPPVVTVFNTLQDAWASVIVSFFTASVLVIIICRLGIHFPQMTVFEYSQKLLGPWFGRVLCFSFLWGLLEIAAVDIRIYGEALVANFFPNTPLIFVIASVAAVSALAAYQGPVVMGRAADLLFPFYVLMIVLSITIPLPQAINQLHNLQPVLARGIMPILGGSAVITAMIANHLVLTVLIPAVTKPEKSLNTALWSLGASTLTIAVVAVVTVAVLGPRKASRTFLPFFGMIRTVLLSRAFERVEILALATWGFGLFILLSIIIYSGSRGLSQIMGLKDHRPLIAPMVVIWSTLATYSMGSVFETKEAFRPDIFVSYWTGLILFPFAVLWGAYFIRRRKL
ncbi:MAG: endospore germination permease [Firmicutes bacterium]|jgi:spore germination protein KB|nr:endospore germination permease [Bacillota bacterium]